MNFLPQYEVDLLRNWFDRGMSIRATVALTGAQRSTVFTYFKAWRRGADPSNKRSYPPSTGRMEACISLEAKIKWVEAASKAGLPLHKFMNAALETIAEDDLFNAIMGD